MRQCRENCGLRAKNEPLTTDATLRRTARAVKYERTRSDNARKTRQTAKRTKDDDAGQPETTCCAQHKRSRKDDSRDNYKEMLLCRLTLELSGGEAVRLNDWLDGSQVTPSVSETIALLWMAGNGAKCLACARRTNR